jgi:hypothetical protein
MQGGFAIGEEVVITMDYASSLREGHTEIAKTALVARLDDLAPRAYKALASPTATGYVAIILNIFGEMDAFLDAALLTEQYDAGITTFDEIAERWDFASEHDVESTIGSRAIWIRTEYEQYLASYKEGKPWRMEPLKTEKK